MNLRSIFLAAILGVCAANDNDPGPGGHNLRHKSDVSEADHIRMLQEGNNDYDYSMSMATILEPAGDDTPATPAAVRNLHPKKIMTVVDKVVATAFGLVGILGLTDKIDEEESIDILTGIIIKADEFESAIGEDWGEGRRRLQSFGTNNNLFVAYIQISVLKLQGLDNAAILDQLTMVFTERVVRIIAGILDPTVATTTSTTSSSSTTATTSLCRFLCCSAMSTTNCDGNTVDTFQECTDLNAADASCVASGLGCTRACGAGTPI